MGLLEDLGIELLWFDSMGAKSFSISVNTSEGPVIIDPGAAVMQPSYPLPARKKIELRRKAMKVIEAKLNEARAVIITHYHYDHHFLPSDKDLSRRDLLLGRILILKNPNKYINRSQWERARIFISEILRISNSSLEEHLITAEEQEFEDPAEKLVLALSKDFGDYQRRREYLLDRGRKWFRELANNLWAKGLWVKEFELENRTKVIWGDGRTFRIGDVSFQVLGPWFHGIEYDRTGWVTPLVIKSTGVIFYSSDLMGPEIEDYAEHISGLRPDVVILDGPPTYLFPFMLNRINLRRALENAITIIKSSPKLVIYDHHLLRERRWRGRVSEVFEEARREDVAIMTASEYLGRTPIIDTI